MQQQPAPPAPSARPLLQAALSPAAFPGGVPGLLIPPPASAHRPRPSPVEDDGLGALGDDLGGSISSRVSPQSEDEKEGEVEEEA